MLIFGESPAWTLIIGVQRRWTCTLVVARWHVIKSRMYLPHMLNRGHAMRTTSECGTGQCIISVRTNRRPVRTGMTRFCFRTNRSYPSAEFDTYEYVGDGDATAEYTTNKKLMKQVMHWRRFFHKRQGRILNKKPITTFSELLSNF